jgi:hypothetical protein
VHHQTSDFLNVVEMLRSLINAVAISQHIFSISMHYAPACTKSVDTEGNIYIDICSPAVTRASFEHGHSSDEDLKQVWRPKRV